MEQPQEKGTEKEAPFLSELDNHDYFSRLRQKHLDKLGERQKLQVAEQRKLQRDQALTWRKDGITAYSKVCLRLDQLKKLIVPHENFKKTMALLEEHRTRSESFRRISSNHSYDIMSSIRNELQSTKFSNQTNLMCWKLTVLKELLRCFDQKQPLAKRQYYHKTNHPLTTMRIILRYYQGFIKVDVNQHNVLKKKRLTFRRAKEKLDKIYRTQEQCEAINHCKSIQHYHPKGCSNCGVIYIGGHLEGAVPYVKSVNRDTGVFTLVTLAFELETLAQEQQVQETLMAKLTEELHAIEDVVYEPIREALQRWWRCVLVYKRLFRTHLRLVKSSYYHHIRRLVRMKSEVDRRVREALRLSEEHFLEQFWDVAPALREYLAHANALKEARVLKYARLFQRKLVVLVEGARERRHREWLRLQSLPPPVKPIVIKRLLPPKLEKFVCYRAECHGRTFLSKERFDIHMKVHQHDDQHRYALYAEHAQKKAVRDQQTIVFLDNVQHSKAFLAQSLLSFPSPLPSLQSPEIQGNSINVNDHSNTNNVTNIVNTNSKDEIQTNTHSTERTGTVSRSLEALQYSPLDWTGQLHHRFNLYDIFATSRSYTLELVSKHADLDAPATIRLDEVMIRMGTHVSCECCLGLRGDSLREGKVSKIHCLLYHHIDTNPDTESDTVSRQGGLTVVDNSSLFGTYIVTLEGARKVPSKITQGLVLTNGALLCIGVMRDGPVMLPVVEANGACLVYRLLIS